MVDAYTCYGSVGEETEVRLEKCSSLCRINNPLVGCEINLLGYYCIFKGLEGKEKGKERKQRELEGI